MAQAPQRAKTSWSEFSLSKWVHDHPEPTRFLYRTINGIACARLLQEVYCGYWEQVPITAIILATSYISKKALSVISPPLHKAQDHLFTTGECRGVSLRYEGHTPILQIPRGTSARDAGYARGFLMAKQIYNFRGRNDTAFIAAKRLSPSFPIKSFLEESQLYIPKKYQKEMRALADGYNAARSSWWVKGSALSYDEVLVFNLLSEQWIGNHGDLSMGATFVLRDTFAGTYAASTWDSDQMGADSFVLFRTATNGVKIVENGSPLLVGSITGMNSDGLCMSLDHVPGYSKHEPGTPPVFYLRMCLEQCQSIFNDQGLYTLSKIGNRSVASGFIFKTVPQSLFSFTALDKMHATSFSVMGMIGDKSKQFNRYWLLDQTPGAISYCSEDWGRTLILGNRNTVQSRGTQLFTLPIDQADLGKGALERLKAVVAKPEVNNKRTVALTIMCPSTREYLVSFNSGWAGDGSFGSIDVASFFDAADDLFYGGYNSSWARLNSLLLPEEKRRLLA